MLTFMLLRLLVLIGKMMEIGVTLTPYTCMGGAWSESQLGHWLCLLKFVVFSLVPPGSCSYNIIMP
jgi:hypothetical protein